MALIGHEDALARDQAPASRQAIDVVKVIVWVAGAVLPWAAIIAGGRWLLAALG